VALYHQRQSNACSLNSQSERPPHRIVSAAQVTVRRCTFRVTSRASWTELVLRSLCWRRAIIQWCGQEVLPIANGPTESRTGFGFILTRRATRAKATTPQSSFNTRTSSVLCTTTTQSKIRTAKTSHTSTKIPTGTITLPRSPSRGTIARIPTMRLRTVPPAATSKPRSDGMNQLGAGFSLISRSTGKRAAARSREPMTGRRSPFASN
jgi:hypothetical protein